MNEFFNPLRNQVALTRMTPNTIFHNVVYLVGDPHKYLQNAARPTAALVQQQQRIYSLHPLQQSSVHCVVHIEVALSIEAGRTRTSVVDGDKSGEGREVAAIQTEK